MVTTATAKSAEVTRGPGIRWCLCDSFVPGEHSQSVRVRWLSADGRELFSTLAVHHDDGEWALLLVNGPELDPDALDAVYDDLARMIAGEGAPFYQVQTPQEVVDGCRHPYASAMKAKGWKFAPGVVCSYCGEAVS